jgi:hypothetical protein
MTRQIPAERPLPNKQLVLDRILDETGTDTASDPRTDRHRRSWALPIAAAAAIAIVATGALTVPKLLKSEDAPAPPPAGRSASTGTTPSTGKPADNPVSIDRGKLTAAQATAFATECIKWVGSKDVPGQNYGDAPLNWPGAGAKVDKILRATKVADYGSGTVWTVAVRTGGHTYGCVGTITKKWPDGRTTRNYDFHTFSERHPQGTDSAGAGGSIGNLDGKQVVTLLSSQWVVVRPGATQVQQRIVVKGKPTAWFTTEVVDGIAYARAWGKGKLGPGDKVQYEARQLDKDGNEVGPVAVERSVVTKGITKESPNMLTPQR